MTIITKGYTSAEIPVGNVVAAADATTGPITTILGDPVTNAGQRLFVLKTDTSANTVSYVFNGLTIVSLTIQGDSATIFSDGTNWNVSRGNANPVVASVLDTFGHVMATFTTGNPNAVNFLDIKNAPAGAGVIISSKGATASIPISILPKGGNAGAGPVIIGDGLTVAPNVAAVADAPAKAALTDIISQLRAIGIYT